MHLVITNTSCCSLCKSVGDIWHSKNLLAKNNRALLATADEDRVDGLYGGSLSQRSGAITKAQP